MKFVELLAVRRKTMYAIIEQGGKQYKVSEGDVLRIELTDTAPDAQEIVLDKVLMVRDENSVRLGSPYLEGAKVTARFDGTAEDSVVKGPKLYPMYFRRRKSSSKKIGHRQKYLQVVIERIEG